MTDGEKLIWASVYARFVTIQREDGTRIDGAHAASYGPVDIATSAVCELRHLLQQWDTLDIHDDMAREMLEQMVGNDPVLELREKPSGQTLETGLRKIKEEFKRTGFSPWKMTLTSQERLALDIACMSLFPKGMPSNDQIMQVIDYAISSNAHPGVRR